jgi:hypothetical protein
MDAMAQEESLHSIPIAVLNRMFFRTRFSEFYWKVLLLIRETHDKENKEN